MRVNNDDFTVLISGSDRHHWVSVCTVWQSHSKWLSKQSNESASNFALNLNVPLWKLFRWFRRLQLLAAGDWQLDQDNTPSHSFHLVQSIFGKTSNHPGGPDTLEPRFGSMRLKSPLKGKRFHTVYEIQENTMGAADGDWENCEVPRCILWRGLRCHCPM